MDEDQLVQVNFRISGAQKKLADEAAKKNKMSLNEWLRTLVSYALIQSPVNGTYERALIEGEIDAAQFMGLITTESVIMMNRLIGMQDALKYDAVGEGISVSKDGVFIECKVGRKSKKGN